MPAEMSGHVIEEYGDPNVFTRATVEMPNPEPNEVRTNVTASSVNPVDYKIRQDALPDFAPDFPAILHCDVSGVDAVGENVDQFEEGDEVYGMPGGAGQQDALADYVVGHAGTFAHAPDTLPLEHAAALPVVALTAWEMLADKTTVEIGDEVLIYGGSGGVGHIGIQLADWFGADVTATASTEEKRKFAANLGADTTVAYTATDVGTYVGEHTDGEGFDLVFDPVGDDHLETAFEAVHPYGTVVTAESSSTQDLSPMHANSLELGVVLVILPVLLGERQERIGEELTDIAALVDDGAIEPHIHDQFSFEKGVDAHQLGEDGDFHGKVTLINN